jgi:GT2 family glycosyltransferase
MHPDVSVIIVSYNVCALLKACIHAVQQQGVQAEIIVIDNVSTDGSADMVRRDFPEVKLIANASNAGFSAANNQGMEVAAGRYLFLLNPDTEMKPGSLRALLDFAATCSEKDMIAPQLLNSDGSLQKSAWKKPSPFDMIKEALFLHLLFGGPEYSTEIYATQFEPGMISGAGMFFNRSLFQQIGGLDANLFWMEDADFSTRVRKAGGKVIYFPFAQVIHHSGQSSKRNLKRVITNQLLSKLKYYSKHQGTLTMIFASAFCVFHIATRLLIFSAAAPFSQPAAEKAGAYFYALGRFFRYLFTGDQRVI